MVNKKPDDQITTKYYLKNREKVKERVKQYYLKNKEKISLYNYEYYIKNKEKIRLRQNKNNLERYRQYKKGNIVKPKKKNKKNIEIEEEQKITLHFV
jgi:hypothetical protein